MEEKFADKGAKSVYSGVDRSAFTPGGVALTNEARNMMNSTGTQFDDGLFDVGLEKSVFGIYSVAGITLMAGISMYAYGKTAVKALEDLKNQFYPSSVEYSTIERAKILRPAVFTRSESKQSFGDFRTAKRIIR